MMPYPLTEIAHSKNKLVTLTTRVATLVADRQTGEIVVTRGHNTYTENPQNIREGIICLH